MALLGEARTCLCSVLLGLTVLLVPFVGIFHTTPQLSWLCILAADIIFANVILLFAYKAKRHSYQIAIRSYFLGLAMGFGMILTFSGFSYSLLGWYLTLLAFFHWSEYFTTAVVNAKSLSLDSFLLDHSPEYHLAAVASVMEFVIECYFFPRLKFPSWLSVLGLLLVIGGEVLRKAAMITATTNFNHYVQDTKQKGHQLVTRGVYGLSRHPAYVGWFYWSIGTQLMLCNPICVLGYTIASWRFFRFRIEHEELTLLNFFGEEYLDYQQKVGTGLPFINGFQVNQ